jgi:hypothetical protein
MDEWMNVRIHSITHVFVSVNNNCPSSTIRQNAIRMWIASIFSILISLSTLMCQWYGKIYKLSPFFFLHTIWHNCKHSKMTSKLYVTKSHSSTLLSMYSHSTFVDDFVVSCLNTSTCFQYFIHNQHLFILNLLLLFKMLEKEEEKFWIKSEINLRRFHF